MVAIPTVTEFRDRFPQFFAVTDIKIQEMIDEATRSVDDEWFETDQKRAIQYLAAHFLEVDEQAAGGSSNIISENFGPLSTTYARNEPDAESLLSTEYGRRFVDLRNRNRSGPVVIC